MTDDTIIINGLPLTEAFVPTKLLHRELQVDELEHCLAPALQDQKVNNVFLVGPTGTGKTSVAKRVLESFLQGRSVSINCWKYRTGHDVLSEILLTLQMPVHGRESVGEQVKKLEKILNQRALVVHLDEIDRLADKDLLYVLSRIGVGLVLSSTSYHTLASLPRRITASLGLSEIRFPKYTIEEAVSIIEDRVKQSLRPGSLTRALLKLSAVLADGDVRVALDTVRRAALFATRGKSTRIALADLEK